MSTDKIKKDSIRTQINKVKMHKHLKQNLGNVRAACDSLGVKKSTFYAWLKKDKELKYLRMDKYFCWCEYTATPNVQNTCALNTWATNR